MKTDKLEKFGTFEIPKIVAFGDEEIKLPSTTASWAEAFGSSNITPTLGLNSQTSISLFVNPPSGNYLGKQ